MQNSITRPQWKVILLSSLGGLLEFYDFVIFAVFAIPIGQAFFPNKTALLSVMSAFAAFAIGYLARPVGGIIFSHFGDKYGRKRSFILTVVIMGAATLMMGVLPGYHTYGIAMSIIFVMLRILQGIAVGGEIPGAITFVSEHVSRSAALACGVVFCFINLGIFLADFVNVLLGMVLKNSVLYNYAWRFAFIFGGLLAVISYFLRQKLEESPEYLKFKGSVAKVPFYALIRSCQRSILAGIMIVAVQAALVSLIYLYVNQYMQLTGLYTRNTISFVTIVALAIFSLGCVFWGAVADRVGYKKLLLVGMCLLIISSYIYYYAIIKAYHVLLVAIVVSIVCSMITGSFSAFLTTLFPTAVRYSGVALCYNVGFAIFAGLTPLLATYLIHLFNNHLIPSYIVMSVAILGIFGVILSRPVKDDVSTVIKTIH